VIFAIFIVIFIVNKNPKALATALASIIILLLFNIISTYQDMSRKEVVVFNLQGKTLIALTSGRETTWLTTPNSGIPDKLSYFTNPYEGYRSIRKSTSTCLSDTSRLTSNIYSCTKNFINFKGLSLCVLDDRKLNEYEREHFPPTDIIILSERSLTNPELVREIAPHALIIESRSLNKVGDENLHSVNALANQPTFNTTQGGAVQITFERGSTEGINILNYGYFNR
jgi:hypothetical protein